MKYLDQSQGTPAADLAADEALLDLAEAGGLAGLLRFWEPVGRFVVLGYANRAATEADLAACAADGVAIYRRCSGGGTVLQGPGCLNYTLVLPQGESGPLHSISGANQFIMERQRAALQPLLPAPVDIAGHTDLVLGDRKFSGNAQRRKRRFLLFHGTFLLHCNLADIARYLRMPSQQPAYRGDRPHGDFVTNLGLSADAVKAALREAWSAHELLTELPEAAITDLVCERYGTEAWNRKW